MISSRTKNTLFAIALTVMVGVGWLGLSLSIYHGKLLSGGRHDSSRTITTFKDDPLQFIVGILIAAIGLALFTGYATFLWSRAFKGEDG
jgi:hypothetical protein